MCIIYNYIYIHVCVCACKYNLHIYTQRIIVYMIILYFLIISDYIWLYLILSDYVLFLCWLLPVLLAHRAASEAPLPVLAQSLPRERTSGHHSAPSSAACPVQDHCYQGKWWMSRLRCTTLIYVHVGHIAICLYIYICVCVRDCVCTLYIIHVCVCACLLIFTFILLLIGPSRRFC